MSKKTYWYEVDGVFGPHDTPHPRDCWAQKGGRWPILSDSIGVHPDQIEEARAESIRIGIPTDFTPDGRAILRTPGHRKRYVQAHGMHDNDGGYSDP